MQALREIAGVHDGDNLAGSHLVALVGAQFGDAVGEFGGDVDRIGLQPAIAVDDPGWNGRNAVRLPNEKTGAAGDQQQDQQAPGPDLAAVPGMMLNDGTRVSCGLP